NLKLLLNLLFLKTFVNPTSLLNPRGILFARSSISLMAHASPAVSLCQAVPSPVEWKAPPSPERIVAAIEESPMTRRHWGFLLSLLGALAFDSMKPATIGFVMPGMKEMFGLSPQTASYLGVSGLTGTFLGSLVWGFLGDRIGRRRGLLF